jgi:hypothetical protein
MAHGPCGVPPEPCHAAEPLSAAECLQGNEQYWNYNMQTCTSGNPMLLKRTQPMLVFKPCTWADAAGVM